MRKLAAMVSFVSLYSSLGIQGSFTLKWHEKLEHPVSIQPYKADGFLPSIVAVVILLHSSTVEKISVGKKLSQSVLRNWVLKEVKMDTEGVLLYDL